MTLFRREKDGGERVGSADTLPRDCIPGVGFSPL